jgi:hypothetical protein
MEEAAMPPCSTPNWHTCKRGLMEHDWVERQKGNECAPVVHMFAIGSRPVRGR